MGFAQFLPAATESAQHPAKRVTTVQETVLRNLSAIIMDSAKIPLVNKLAHATIVIRQTPYAMAMESVKQNLEKMSQTVQVIVNVEMESAMQVPTEKRAKPVLEIVEHVSHVVMEHALLNTGKTSSAALPIAIVETACARRLNMERILPTALLIAKHYRRTPLATTTEPVIVERTQQHVATASPVQSSVTATI